MFLKQLMHLLECNEITIIKLSTICNVNPEAINTLHGHEHYVESLTVIGERFVSLSPDKTLRVWDGRDGRMLVVKETAEGLSSITLPNGNFASGHGDGSIKIWCSDNLTCLKTLAHSRKVVWCFDIFKDELLVSGSMDGIIKIWNWRTYECIDTIKIEPVKSIESIAVIQGNKIATGCHDGSVHIWDSETRKWTKAKEPHTAEHIWTLLALSGNCFASGSDDGTIKLWNADTGICLRTVEAHHGGVPILKKLPTGSIVSGGKDNSIKIWDKAWSCLYTLQGHAGGIPSLAYSETLGTLVSGSYDKTIRLWNLRAALTDEDIQDIFNAAKICGSLRTIDLSDITLSNASTTTLIDLIMSRPSLNIHVINLHVPKELQDGLQTALANALRRILPSSIALSVVARESSVEPSLSEMLDKKLIDAITYLSEINLSEKPVPELLIETKKLDEKISELSTHLEGAVRLSEGQRQLLIKQLKQTQKQQLIISQQTEIQKEPKLYAYYSAFQLYFTRIYLGAQVISSSLTNLSEDEFDEGMHLVSRIVTAIPLIGHVLSIAADAAMTIHDYRRVLIFKKLTWLAVDIREAGRLFEEVARLLTLAQQEDLMRIREAPSGLMTKLRERTIAVVDRLTGTDFQAPSEKLALKHAETIVDVILHDKQDKRSKIVKLTRGRSLTARELALILIEESTLACVLSSDDTSYTDVSPSVLLTEIGSFSGGGGADDSGVPYVTSERVTALETQLANMQRTQAETLRRLQALKPEADLTVSGGREAQQFQLPEETPVVVSEIENLKKQVAEQQQAISQLIAIVSTLKDEWHLTPVRAREDREADEERRDELFDVKPRMPDLR